MSRHYGNDGRPALQRRYQGTKGVGTFRILVMLGMLMTGGTYAGRELQDRMIGGLQEWSGIRPPVQSVSQPVAASSTAIDF